MQSHSPLVRSFVRARGASDLPAPVQKPALSLAFHGRGVESELLKISGEIGWYEDQTRKTLRLALQYKLEIGRRLALAKQILPHGEFLPWAQREFGWTPRHVQKHLMLAANAACVSRLPAGSSLRMALVAIGELRAERDVGHSGSARLNRPERICIVGEIEDGILDEDKLLNGLGHLSEEMGAMRTHWKIRRSRSAQVNQHHILNREQPILKGRL